MADHPAVTPSLPGTPPFRRRLLLGAALAAPFIRPARAEIAGRVALIHMNDFHSKHEGLQENGAVCRADRPCMGGAARLATAIAEARAAAAAEGRENLYLDAGDQFMGSLYYTAHRGLTEAAVQRLTRPDAMALGNHEFDNGPATLAAYAARVPFPLLSANLDLSAEPLLKDRVTPYAMFERGGRRFAVIGLTTETTPIASSPGPTVKFTDAQAAAERAIASMRAAESGPVTVILLSHLGLEQDQQMAENVAGVDVIVGGHSHLLLANGLPGAIGPDPLVIEGQDRDVRILQAGAFGRWLGRLDLDLDERGHIAAHAASMRPITPDIPEDPAVAQLIAQFGSPLAELRARPVAQVGGPFSDAACRVGECAIGNLVADALLAAVPGADAAITNAGGLRAALPGGVVRWGDVLTVLPFGNTLAIMTLRGGELLAALENGVSALPASAGRYPQVAGIRFAIDAAAPPGQRIRDAVLVKGGREVPLEPDRAYRVVTNNFMRTGGDGYTMFRDRALEAYDTGPALEEVVAEWLSAAPRAPHIGDRQRRS
ncbi:5'-nucleotidase C-terminal domain-containing protein [Acetobacteraceae bacterium H6797]|nr:5'-nucleotidase C-terminal domain-containing protein [Acetobacteraceae bacterium H6797]